MLYNFVMTRQKVFWLVVILVLIAVSIFFYFYIKNKEVEVYIPPVVEKTPAEIKEEAEREALKKLDASKPKPAEPVAEEVMRETLDDFKPAPSVKKPTEEEMRKRLLEANSQANP